MRRIAEAPRQRGDDIGHVEAPGVPRSPRSAVTRSEASRITRFGESSKLRLVLIIAAVTLIAIGLRGRAVATLRPDWDEDNYIRAAQRYAVGLRSGDWDRALNDPELQEHPALGKLLYAAVIAVQPPGRTVDDREIWRPPTRNDPLPHLRSSRTAAAVLGTAAVAALAVLDPLAGLLLAIDTWNIKYTSEVYLEAPASLAALVSVLSYVKSRRRPGPWLVIAAVALGLTAATKYVYAVVVGGAMLLDWLWSLYRERRLARPTPPALEGSAAPPAGDDASAEDRLVAASAPPQQRDARVPDTTFRTAIAALAVWVLVALAVFFVADIDLWPDPIGRLRSSLSFHPAYATGESVRDANLPPWQIVRWLSDSVPAHDGSTIFSRIGGHRGVFVVALDMVIAALAILGLRRTWQRHRVFVLWMAVGLAFLLVWPSKWPQYSVVLTVPLTVSAAQAIRQAAELLRSAGSRVWTHRRSRDA